MSTPATVMVLTPSLGGHYFGELLTGLGREVSAAHGRMVVVETRPASAPRDELWEPSDFATPVGWSGVDGVVSITTAANVPYLRRLREAGVTVVLSSTRMEDFPAPAAMPDNHGGTFAAVEHLIAHGHADIGFVGNFTQPDVRDRFDAYAAAMKAHGLAVSSDAVINAADNGEVGGREAAGKLLRSPHRPTALMVATDRNALGLMAVLAEAGVRVPDDLAVVGFDTIEAGAFAVPALSSVNQRFDEVGALAGRLVLAGIRGETVPNRVFTAQSVVLALRESCGCTADGHRAQPHAGGRLVGTPAGQPHDELQHALVTVLLAGKEPGDATRDAVLASVGTIERLLTADTGVTDVEIRDLVVSLSRLTPSPDALRRVLDAVVSYAERVAPDGSAARSAVAARIAAALWKAQAGGLLRQVETTEVAIAEQYVVDRGLLDAGENDPRDLDWLAGTHVTTGVLALWDGDPGRGRLTVAGTYDPFRRVPGLVGSGVSVRDFPPATMTSGAAAGAPDVCVVVPVRTAARDWGLLAVVGEVDTRSARETYRHWASLLCTALESRRLQDEVRRNALYDSLTGLPNRRLFLERLDSAIADHHRSGTPFAVLFLDLDGFKLINDTLGHPAGDRVLTVVGDRIAQELRSVDTGARFGGDEFAILLHDTDAAGGLVVAQRVQAVLARGLDLEGRSVSVRASIGIAASSVAYSSGEEILREADTAMYRAKTTEPGTVAYFDEAMRSQAVHQQVLNAEIVAALKEDQLEVFYQPIVNLASGRADRFEALVRWRHPERGLLLPHEFLTEMEETGLVVSLGRRVVEKVCRQLALWGPRVVNVSINVSDREFWNRGLLPHVLATLEREGLTPDRLTLEVTEATLKRHPDAALRLMTEMHDAGLRLHIDAFGTGYSTLETLHRFPVDAFKIDRRFLRTLASGDRTTELLTALVSLGTSLGLAVVAEGVETLDQLVFLQDIGCATGQGYLFMPAVSGDHATELLDRDLAAPLAPLDSASPPAPLGVSDR